MKDDASSDGAVVGNVENFSPDFFLLFFGFFIDCLVYIFKPPCVCGFCSISLAINSLSYSIMAEKMLDISVLLNLLRLTLWPKV